MTKEKYALLVIDMQQVAFDGKVTPPISSGNKLLYNISRLILGCRTACVPIIYAQTCAPSGRPYAKDVHGWVLHPDIAPLNDELVVFKVGPSAFETSILESTLSEQAITELIICGTWSEGCVSITAKGALKRGYAVSLVADGHGTVRDSEQKAEAVVAEQNAILQSRGAKVVDVDTVVKTVSNS